MKIAIFADVHGKLLLPFKMVDWYQQQTGEKIDLILQCGDLGAYPDIKTMDKATLKHAKNDRDELGFIEHFVKPNAQIEQFLHKLDINMLCVRGNHEDHAFLDELEQQTAETAFAIDCYQRVFICKSGVVQHLQLAGESLTVLGIGRIGDHKGRSEPRFIQPYEQQQLKKLLKKAPLLDVLISHDKDIDSLRGYGMQELRTVLDEIPFSYMFHGHTGEPYHQRLDKNDITRIVKVRELEFNHSGILEEGCMLILTKEQDQLSFESVPLSFIHQFQKANWRLM